MKEARLGKTEKKKEEKEGGIKKGLRNK